MDFARLSDSKEERNLRFAHIDLEAFGSILARVYDTAIQNSSTARNTTEDGEVEQPALPYFYCGTLEEPLRFYPSHATLRFELEYLEAPALKILLKP